MHELAISRAILDIATRHAEGRPVVLVSVTVGALRQVVPESLAFHFQIAARGTLCEGAELEPRLVAARLRCECGREWQLEEPCFRCPGCGGAEVSVLDGEQLSVEEIELEELPCTARR